MPNIEINGIVAARNKEPYVQLCADSKVIAQLSMSETRKIANDLYLAASRAEADAMLLRFFENQELPEQAGAVLMVEFRDFRLGLDLDTPQGYHAPPDDSAASVASRPCELCLKVAPTRPYGPNGEQICFPCWRKNNDGPIPHQ